VPAWCALRKAGNGHWPAEGSSRSDGTLDPDGQSENNWHFQQP
jgi:hypothetical protein